VVLNPVAPGRRRAMRTASDRTRAPQGGRDERLMQRPAHGHVAGPCRAWCRAPQFRALTRDPPHPPATRVATWPDLERLVRTSVPIATILAGPFCVVGRGQPGTPDPASVTNDATEGEPHYGTTGRIGARSGVDAGRPRDHDLRPVGMNVQLSARNVACGASLRPLGARAPRRFTGVVRALAEQAAPSRAPRLGRGLKTYRKFSQDCPDMIVRLRLMGDTPAPNDG
jgi:hypothetical protein